MNWKHHARELGLDLLLGLTLYMSPLVYAEDFSWSSQWWLILLGGAARRATGIVLSYIRRVLRDRTPPE